MAVAYRPNLSVRSELEGYPVDYKEQTLKVRKFLDWELQQASIAV